MLNRRRFLAESLASGVAATIPTQSAFAAMMQALTQVTSNIGAISLNGAEIELEQAAVQELSDSLRGNLLLPGSEGYDVARRVLNQSIDKYPALIVRPSGVADIQNAVTFARERELLLAVKCGGHSYSGKSTCDAGMQIDLSSFRNARVDPSSRTAYIAGGSHLAELDHEAMAQGLVTTAGTVSHTGVGGLTLGGGFGRLARRYGLALDNVKAVDIVTADGQLRHASADENPDLYWAVRGGGGNFGVVTSFEFALHPMQRTVVGGVIGFPLQRAADVLRLYADFSMQAPDDLYLDFLMVSPPGGEGGIVMISVCYSGPENKADAVLAPLKKLGEPILNQIGAIDYVALQKNFDNSDPRNGGEYLKSGFTSEISGSLIDAVVSGFKSDPDRTNMLFFQHSGGAIGRVPVDATAFAHRYSSHNLFTTVTWNRGVDRGPHIEYVRAYWSSMEGHTRGVYTNEISDEAQAHVNKNYQGNFDRLLEIKQKYDPGNLFRMNANIKAA
jgi:FAD/FMN-containing dehydrogenase